MFAPFNGLKSLVARLHRNLKPSPKPKSVKHRPAQRTVLTLESLEARENPSAVVPFTGGQPVAHNVQYLLPGAAIGQYALESNGTLLNLSTSTVMLPGIAVQEAAISISQYGVTLAALSGTTLRWSFGGPGANFTSFAFGDGNVLSTYTSSMTGVAGFELGSDGSVDDLHYGGFFAHRSSPNGYGPGSTPTVELGNVSKFEVAPNNTLYTLQTTGGWLGNGTLDGWNGNSVVSGQAHIVQFDVDQYNNLVTLNNSLAPLLHGRYVVYINGSLASGPNNTATVLYYNDNQGDLSWY
jgi:hypothetical protein